MKERWERLSLQEKQIVSGGGLLLMIVLIYFFFWAPLANKTANLRDQLQHNQELLSWMQKTDKQMQLMEKQITLKHSSVPNVSLLSRVQYYVKQSVIAQDVTELHQVENDAVQLNFKQVNFDDLIKWIIEIWQKEGMIVTQITVVPSDVSGKVTADMVLKIEA